MKNAISIYYLTKKKGDCIVDRSQSPRSMCISQFELRRLMFRILLQFSKRMFVCSMTVLGCMFDIRVVFVIMEAVPLPLPTIWVLGQLRLRVISFVWFWVVSKFGDPSK